MRISEVTERGGQSSDREGNEEKMRKRMRERREGKRDLDVSTEVLDTLVTSSILEMIIHPTKENLR